MRREIYSLIAGVLFYIRSSEAQITCSHPPREYFGRKVVLCDAPPNVTIMELPESLSNDVQFLRVEMQNTTTFKINRLNAFSNFKSLIGLDITVGKALRLEDSLLEFEMREKLKTELFDLPRLKILVIKFLIFNEQRKFNFELPASLEEFTLINSTMNLDGLLNANLRKLNISGNNISRMPTNEKLYHLSSLDLSDNPLNESTVNDIAPFCSLKYLRINNSNIGSCECLKLQKFITLLEKNVDQFKFEGSLPCSNVNSSDRKCSLDVNEAMNKRRKCVVTLMRPIAFELVDYGIIFLLLLAFCIGCCVFLFKNLVKIDIMS